MAKTATLEKAQPLPMRRRLINARLLTLLRLARMSGEIAYRRQIALTQMHGRLVTLLGNYGALSSAELVRLTGSDKAQISRAIKAMTDAGLISRAGLRAAIDLTPEGAAIFDRIMAVAHGRDQALTRGIGKTELGRFATATAELTHRAAHLLSIERQLSADAEAAGDPTEAGPVPDKPPQPGRPDAGMTLPSIMSLVSYLQRSATVAYKRETGVSQFEWQILSQIAEHQPITLAALIQLSGRDKSHVGRTLKRLVEERLVEQHRAPGKRETVLDTTPHGAEVYDAMCGIAVRRDDYLFAEAAAGARDAYVATIGKLTANAEAMLRDEQKRK